VPDIPLMRRVEERERPKESSNPALTRDVVISAQESTGVERFAVKILMSEWGCMALDDASVWPVQKNTTCVATFQCT
jgi:hypothetical protein